MFDESFFADAEMISGYSRKQAIADGVLIDLTNATDKSGGRLSPFKWPIAMTSTAFGECVEAGGWWVPDGQGGEELELPGCQDMVGRISDVFNVLLAKIRAVDGETDRVHFKVSVLVDGETERKTVELYSVIGPGDTPEPVITIMLEGED
jgi:hypothetical protein